MNITHNVIRDLLPLYADNAVSPDTRALVEEYLQLNPEVAKEVAELRAPVPASYFGADQRTELASLKATKRRLNMRGVWMGLGIFFSASVLGVYFDGEQMKWVWNSFPAGSIIAGMLGAFSWLLFGLSHRRTRAAGV